ncbi:MAG: FHA domain-containing protein [Anaerolineales bacterium]|nr:FHA domain-containing protein [Anaerolineales bacterium]
MSFGRIEIKYADGKTVTIELTKRQMAVGRASDVEVPVNDGQVSRRHALLLCGPEGVRIVDAGSVNGTFLGQSRLPAQQPVPLTDGAVLRLGTTQLKFLAGAGEPDEAPLPSVRPDRAEHETAIKPPAPAVSPSVGATDTRPPAPANPPPAFGSPPPPAAPAAETSAAGPRPTPPGVPTDRSTYLKFRPALYSADDFLGRFLLIFESILGPIERTVDNLPFYFDAQMTPPEVLPWLASWLGLVLDERWPEARRRELIRAAVELYQWRGTRRGLTEFLRLYTGVTPDIIESDPRRQTVTADEAFRFVVRLRVPNPASLDRAVIEAIIDSEKPAHAGYTLEIGSS